MTRAQLYRRAMARLAALGVLAGGGLWLASEVIGLAVAIRG